MDARDETALTLARGGGLDRRELLRRAGIGAGLAGLGPLLSTPAGVDAARLHAGLSQVDPTAIKKGGTLIEGASGLTIDSLAPIVDANRHTLFLFDPLVSVDATSLLPVPNLATEWTISDDGLVYTFTLKEGVVFHDGAPFTSADVKFTFELLLNPDTASPYLSIFGERIASIEAPDPQTVVFTLLQPVASFLNDFSNYSLGILPQHLLADVQPADLVTSEFSQSKPVGTGPFMFQEYLPGEALTLAANPDYHRGAPALDRYVLKLLADPTAAYQQLKTGEADIARVSADFYEDATQQDNFTPVPFDTFGMYMLAFNVDPAKGSPALQDVKVRRAIVHAIDRQVILDRIYSGLGTVAIGTEPSVSWAHQPDQITETYPYDTERAAALLDEAGWTLNGDVREKDGQPLAFSIVASAVSKTDEGTVLAIQEYLSEVGIEVTPQFEEESPLTTLPGSREFEAAFFSFTFAPDPDQSLAWHSGGIEAGYNVFGYNNPAVDDLLERGLETVDVEERTAIYVEMQNILVADLPAAVLLFQKSALGINNRVKNYVPSAVGYSWAVHYDAPLWYVEDGR